MTAQDDGDIYPEGAVLRLINSDRMTNATSAALCKRVATVSETPNTPILDELQMAALAAIAAHLIPQSERTAAIDLVGAFHTRLGEGSGMGWRYAKLPAMIPLHQRGLTAVDATAIAVFGKPFVALPPPSQNELLRAIQAGQNDEPAGEGVDPALWFTELLATLVDIFYSHPLAQDEIGFAGMADAHGWPEVGLGARESHEPMPLSVRSDQDRP